MKPVRLASRSEFLPVRGLHYHLRHWGPQDAPVLFMVHGWMDVSASFQFVVDQLRNDWHVIAPDLRGFGLTAAPGTDTYWFADYLADMDAIFRHYAPEGQLNVLGHSMGANVVSMYAGIQPERIRRLINLEGFGLPATAPEQAPKRFRKWLAEMRQAPQLRDYASPQEVAARLQKTNPRLDDDKALWLAQHWSRQNAAGRWEILGDPVHKQTSPLLFRVDEFLACWANISAPVLWMEAEHTDVWDWMGPKEQARAEIDRRLAIIPNLQKAWITDAGHMLHHDQPEWLAKLIEGRHDKHQQAKPATTAKLITAGDNGCSSFLPLLLCVDRSKRHMRHARYVLPAASLRSPDSNNGDARQSMLKGEMSLVFTLICRNLSYCIAQCG